VTTAKFVGFVYAGGYGRGMLWSEQSWAWRLRRGQAFALLVERRQLSGPTVASTSPSPGPTRARVPRQVVRGPGLLRPVDVAAFSEGGRVFGLRQMLVNKRERCVGDFLPYPGFVRDTCENQSELWFGDKLLSGGGWVTRGRMLRSTWRNFYTPSNYAL